MKAVPLIGIARHRLTIDGEGVTTLVAFHGCPLRCKYCLNPTSLQPDGVWESYDCNQLYEEVRKDELYFLASCGGVTFGGGEPLLQSEFIRQFRQLCGPEWRITVETSLNVPQQNVEELISIIDNYIVDIKDMNNNIYQRYTGKNNENVLSNLRYLIGKDKAKQIVIRTPLIPSYNTEKDIDQSIELLKEMGITQFDRFTYKPLMINAMARGKQTCKILKEIRRQIAEANDIEFITSECQYQGDCLGTCPKCEAEVRYLEQQLERKRRVGKAITLFGLSTGILTIIPPTSLDAETLQCPKMNWTITADSLIQEKDMKGEAPFMVRKSYRNFPEEQKNL